MGTSTRILSERAALDADDVLPVLYRPNTHGEIIEREWTPNLGTGLELRHLAMCCQMAIEFWHCVLEDARISDDFNRQVADRHLSTLRTLHV